MTDRETFLAAIQADPADGAAKCAFADWLSERGEIDLAYAFHWVAKRDLHPMVSPSGRSVLWMSDEKVNAKKQYGEAGKRAQIPVVLFQCLNAPTSYSWPARRGCRGLERCFVLLGAALKKLRDAVEIPQ